MIPESPKKFRSLSEMRKHDIISCGVMMIIVGIVCYVLGTSIYEHGSQEHISYTDFGNEVAPAREPGRIGYLYAARFGIVLSVAGLITFVAGKMKK